MNRLIVTFLVALTVNFAYAQIKEKRNVENFNSIEVKDVAKLVLVQSDTVSISIETDEKKLDDIITEVKGGKLTIKFKEGFLFDPNYKVIVHYKSIQLLDVSGTANVSTENTMNEKKLEIIAGGASRLTLDVVLKELTSQIHGAAVVNLSGAAETHSTEISGAASLKASKLSCITVNVNSSGASKAKVNANKSLTINASGVSSVKYYGEPEIKNINYSTTSSVEQMSLVDDNVKLNDIDTTKIKLGKRKYIIIDQDKKRDGYIHLKNKLKHWHGLELGVNGFLAADQSISLTGKNEFMSLEYGLKSLLVNLNLYEKHIHVYKNYINLVTGIGLSFNSYQLKNKVTLNSDSSYTYFYNTNLNFQKNKLKMSFIQIPLLLEFNSSDIKSKAWHIAGGVIAGYKLTSKTKQIYVENGNEFKSIKKDDYNLNPFKLDLTARVGFGNFTVFGTYALNSLFEKNKGPELYPFSVGLRVIPF